MTQDKPTKTAMMELIQFILDNRGSQKDILDEAKYLLEKEKTQIVDAFVSGCTNSAFDIEYGELAEKHFNSTCKQ